MGQAASSKTVLIADDSRFFRSMLSYALNEDGLRTLVASSGDEALEILGRELPDVHLLLLDLVMPGLNGFQVVERLRSMEAAARLPIIVVSQYSLNQVEKGILHKHGIDIALTKSAAMERILFEVREALFPEERERRRTSRMAVSLAVTVRAPPATHITSSFNVSDTGMFLAFAGEEMPRPGTQIGLKFWVPDQGQIFDLQARVAWLNAPGADYRRSHPAGFGVEFLAPPDEVRDAIRSFLRASV